MGLRIIYGRAGSGKSEFCFNEISKIIDKEKNIYIITPEQFSFTAEKKLMEAVGRDAVINAEVITLSRMAERVLSEIGENRQTLTKTGKAMIIYDVLNQNKRKFKFLGKSDENIDLGISSITEFKKHGVTVEGLKAEAQKTENKYLKTKLEDMILLYENYDEIIRSTYIEETDKLTRLSENIEKIDFLKNSVIYIDEFSGFTYQEYQVIKELVKVAKQLSITICTDSLQVLENPDTDVFYSNKLTINRLIQLLEMENIKVDEKIYLEETKRFKVPELTYLEKNLYNKKSTKYLQKVENIHLFLAKNQYTEIENVAKQIVKLVRDNKLRYKDIGIITRNTEKYANLARAIFQKYDIPVFIDEKRDLSQNIIIQYVLSIFEILQKNFTQESVFNYLKMGFLDIDREDIYELENYCTKWAIKQNKWKKDFVYEINNEDKKQKVEYFNELRKRIVNPILELKEKIQKSKTVENISKEIYYFLIKNDIELKLKEKMDYLNENGYIDLANEYNESFQVFIDVLDEMVSIFKNKSVSIDEYYQILKVGFKNSGLGKIPGTQDQVIMGDVERSRSHKVKVIFIIGLNDGSFPNVHKDEGFFGDDDRAILKEDGIELANGTIENLYEDNFNIYKAFTTAENQIYLSYSSADNEGKSLRPSIMIHKIKKMYSKLIEESDVINPKYEITNLLGTYEELLDNIAQKQNGKKIEKIWYDVFEYYKQNDKMNKKLSCDMQGLKYTNIPEEINKEEIEKLYGNVLKTSVSRLERYRSCPFSYYLQYGLNLKEKEELKIQSFDTGSFMHEVIDKFFKKVSEENISLSDLLVDDELLIKVVNIIVLEELEESSNHKFRETVKYKILVTRLKRLITKALKFIIESLVYSDFSIEGTEIEFDKKGKYKPIEIQLEDGKKIEIVGKIDRIDTAQTDDGKIFRIIDYKSSAKNIDLNEVYAGLQIQLLTYMDAVCKEEDFLPVGVLYFGLIEQMIKVDKKINEQEIENKLRENFKMKGLILADVKIIQMQDNNLANGGTSKLIPAGITSKGEINKRSTSGVNQEEFKILQEYITKVIKEIAKEILRGRIDLKPYNKKGKTPCEYCSYKSICGFDTRLCNNTYNYIDKNSNDQVIKQMAEKILS